MNKLLLALGSVGSIVSVATPIAATTINSKINTKTNTNIKANAELNAEDDYNAFYINGLKDAEGKAQEMFINNIENISDGLIMELGDGFEQEMSYIPLISINPNIDTLNYSINFSQNGYVYFQGFSDIELRTTFGQKFTLERSTFHFAVDREGNSALKFEFNDSYNREQFDQLFGNNIGNLSNGDIPMLVTDQVDLNLDTDFDYKGFGEEGILPYFNKFGTKFGSETETLFVEKTIGNGEILHQKEYYAPDGYQHMQVEQELPNIVQMNFMYGNGEFTGINLTVPLYAEDDYEFGTGAIYNMILRENGRSDSLDGQDPKILLERAADEPYHFGKHVEDGLTGHSIGEGVKMISITLGVISHIFI